MNTLKERICRNIVNNGDIANLLPSKVLQKLVNIIEHLNVEMHREERQKT